MVAFAIRQLIDTVNAIKTKSTIFAGRMAEAVDKHIPNSRVKVADGDHSLGHSGRPITIDQINHFTSDAAQNGDPTPYLKAFTRQSRLQAASEGTYLLD